MNYMPTKSRKWLASGIATAVIASALSLFTVAPASAAPGATLALSKPLRATSSNGSTIAIGSQSGIGTDDTTALIFSLDDSSVTSAWTGAGTNDADIYFRVVTSPADASGTANGAVFSIANRNSEPSAGLDPGPTGFMAASEGTWYLLNEDTLFAANATGDDTLSADDTKLAFNFKVDLEGTYTVEYVMDFDQSGSSVPSSNDATGSLTIVAYGAPAVTITSDLTRKGAGDDTITITLTGGALGTQEQLWMTDDSTFHSSFRAKSARAYAGATAAADLTAPYEDTMVIEDTFDWVMTSTSTMTLTIVLDDSSNQLASEGAGDDHTGTVKVWRKAGWVTPASKASAATLTVTASTLVSAIQSLDITAPTTNIIEEDTPASGVYSGTYLKSATTSGSTTLSGTFQLTNVADYGKSVTVALYGDSESTVDATDTPISTSSIVSASATGVGTWTFTVPNSYLDASGDTITVYVGNVNTANTAAGSTPKAYQMTATSANPTPVWTVNGITWKSSEDFAGVLIAAVGGTITASVKAQDQYGNALTGQSIVLTTSSTQRNASKRVQSAVSGATGVVSVSMTDAGTAVSTTTATTRDAITLSLVDGLEDDTVGSTESVTVAYYTANTLTAPTINGVAAAAYDGEPVVPGDGTAGLWASGDGTNASADNATDDSMLQFKVTSSVVGASVIFTGSSGVRFQYDDSVAPLSNSNIGGANKTIAAKKGTTKVIVASDSTTGVATVYFYCVTAGDCTVTGTAGSATSSATVAYSTHTDFARDVIDVKVNDVVGTTGTSAADKKVKVSFKVVDMHGNAVKTFGSTNTVDVMVSGVGSIDGIGSQGTLKTAADGTAQFYAASSAAGSMQITLDGSGGQFAGVASTTLGTSAAADKKTVTITWSAAPAPEVVYAAPTLTVTKSGNKIILDGTAVEGEGDIIVYIKRVGTTKWVEQAATIEVAAPGDYNGMRIAPKSNVLIRVKQEGTGKFSNQVVVLK